MDRCNVLVVGAGPAGLGFAARLAQLGVKSIVVLERETQAGGVPRHCGHWGFGWESHRRLVTGPQFVARLRREAEGCEVRTSHSVVQVSGTVAQVQSPERGLFEMGFNHIVFACGARESTRAARLIGGVRGASIMNTGTLQQMAYLKNMRPFERPIILGGEWLSFSALMTCKHAGIKPAAMVVEGPALEAPRIFAWAARAWYGVPVLRNVDALAVEGGAAVTGLRVRHKGQEKVLDCDGVIVSGRLVPEDFLLGGFETSPVLLGNMQGEIKTAGRCVAEARRQAEVFARQIA